MHLPDLPPDITFPILPRDSEALRYAFDAKRDAMGPYIRERWGWDEDLQLRLHRAHFDAKPFFKILHREIPVGTVSVMASGDHIRFGEFYVFARHQRNGTGTKVLRHCLALADARGMPIRLEYLKWNPVGSLYRRHGFVPVGETEIHWLMERRPPHDICATAN